jgi:hypothetical protein
MTEKEKIVMNNLRATGRLRGGIQAERAGDAVLLEGGGYIPDRFIRGKQGAYSLTFDATTFVTDPTSCLVYGDDCADWDPVDNTGASIDVGNWGMDSPFFDDCYYCTMNGDGDILHELDPMDLTKSADGEDCSTEIMQNNVMFVIPRRYIKRNATRIVHSMSERRGTPDPFVRGGHTYNYCAIGVYPMTIVDGVGKSVSGVLPTNNTAGASFRSAAKANNTDLEWHVWNWHEYQMYRDMVLFGAKSFDSQGVIGKGMCNAGNSADNWIVNGGADHAIDKAGPWCGDLTATNKPVKALLENVWGELWQLVDDCLLTAYRADETDPEHPLYYQDFYAGQNDNDHIDDLTTSKTLIASIPVPDARIASGGWVYTHEIDVTQPGWGLPADKDGDTSTGLCDGHYMDARGQRAVRVGGRSGGGLRAGVSALALDRGLSSSFWYCGARVAFTFD